MPEFLAGDVHEITANLAYQLWEQRGRPFGSPEVDWFAAEKTFGGVTATSGTGAAPVRHNPGQTRERIADEFAKNLKRRSMSLGV
jgi:hypothetical protein